MLLSSLPGSPILAESESVAVPDGYAVEETRSVRPPTDTPYGHQQLMDTIEGIPINRIEIATHPHDQAAIELDGFVTEQVWMETPRYDNMLVSAPGTGEPAHYPTNVRMLATERALYVSAVMEQPPESLVTRMSNRDENIDRDAFGLTLDTTGEGLFAYWFIFALGDSVMDGDLIPVTMTDGGRDFNVTLLTAQLRYRWEIAPLTELYLVYNLGNNRTTFSHTDFEDLFEDSFSDPS